MNRQQRRAKGMTRRDFMKTMAVLGAAASSSGLLQSCGSSSNNRQLEKKTFYFDHANYDPNKNDFYLIIGSRQLALSRATKKDIDKAKENNRFLKALPQDVITHVGVNIEFPSDCPQLCYVTMKPKDSKNSSNWKIATMFINFPLSSLEKLAKQPQNSNSYSAKAKFYGLDNSNSYLAYNVIEESFLINSLDTASSIVFFSPEVMSLEPDSGAYIVQNIINNQTSTLRFAQAIQAQGSDWATYRTLIDPDTQQPLLDSHGNPLQIPVYSDLTIQFGGVAIIDAVANVKKDNSLYVNISNITDPSQSKGKICTVRDGRTYTDVNQQKANSTSDVTYNIVDVATGGGYSCELTGFWKNSDGTYMCEVKITNSYLRHVGIFVRYIDPLANVIKLSEISQDFFANWGFCFDKVCSSSDDTIYVTYVDPQYNVFGVPIKSTELKILIPIPKEANGIQIIGETLGIYEKVHVDVPCTIGLYLTLFLELIVPALMLTAGVAGLSTYLQGLQANKTRTAVQVMKIMIDIASKIITGIVTKNTDAIIGLVLKYAALILANHEIEIVVELEAILGTSRIKDLIPVVGLIITAVSTVADAASLTETTYAIFNSPSFYLTTLTLSHTITITINHDPQNPEGFPSVATYFQVTAVCTRVNSSGQIVYSSTPFVLKQNMPPTQRTEPLSVTITQFPYGGKVSIAVGFYSDTGWLAGYATLKDGDNTQTSFTLTITQYQVPLTQNTTYSHKEKIALDDSGTHIWVATKTPPQPKLTGECGGVPGQLCSIINVTDSNTFASVGYAWQAYNLLYGAQKFFIGNVSTTQNPESSAFVSLPLNMPTRIVYDLLGDSQTQRHFYIDTQKGNIIRQIRLSLQGKPQYDAPNSNKAWGKLNFSSDGLLLHPNNKLVSLNSVLNKLEVINLPQQPTTDDNAPIAAVYGGEGEREGLLNEPICAAITSRGEILILEKGNNRIQAFDTGGNPLKIFYNKSSYFATLKYPANQYKYIDMATEYSGYIYLLSYIYDGAIYQFFLDIYTPDGQFLSRTSNFSAARITVSYWRDVFAANFEVVRLPNGNLPASGITEPSISRWIPSTP